ncbi:MAG: hypothetical protein EA341_00490 [Mongoliibacter sp.]|nr:MAG: hypothetical protein EA341_00490 [Mongoliibacter sp.]
MRNQIPYFSKNNFKIEIKSIWIISTFNHYKIQEKAGLQEISITLYRNPLTTHPPVIRSLWLRISGL